MAEERATSGGRATSVRGPIAIVTMNRPEYRNAQNSAMTYALDARVPARRSTTTTVKVIVLAGAGKHFSAGHDIGTPGPRRRRALRQHGDHLVGPRRPRRRRPALRPRDGGLSRHVPAVARDPQADDRDGAGRLHRRRADAGVRLRPDRRLRRRVLRRSRGAHGDSGRRVLRAPVGARPARGQGDPVHRRPLLARSAPTSGAWSTASSPRDRARGRDAGASPSGSPRCRGSGWR